MACWEKVRFANLMIFLRVKSSAIERIHATKIHIARREKVKGVWWMWVIVHCIGCENVAEINCMVG